MAKIKKQRGRPPASESTKRKEMIWIRATEEERADWSTAAAEMRMALSTWARLILNQEVKRLGR